MKKGRPALGVVCVRTDLPGSWSIRRSSRCPRSGRSPRGHRRRRVPPKVPSGVVRAEPSWLPPNRVWRSGGRADSAGAVRARARFDRACLSALTITRTESSPPYRMTSVWRSPSAVTSVTTASRPRPCSAAGTCVASPVSTCVAFPVSSGTPATTGTARAPSAVGSGGRAFTRNGLRGPATFWVSQPGPLISARRGRYRVSLRRQDCRER